MNKQELENALSQNITIEKRMELFTQLIKLNKTK